MSLPTPGPDRAALVTGASQGIGAEIARELARRGHRLVLVARSALPSVMWVDAAEVAKAAVDGLDKGRMVVIPGVANRVAAAMAQVTPRSLLLPVLRTHPGLK